MTPTLKLLGLEHATTVAISATINTAQLFPSYFILKLTVGISDRVHTYAWCQMLSATNSLEYIDLGNLKHDLDKNFFLVIAR